MKCEVEFLAVGDNSKAGDAIVIRYGEPHDYKLMLVDGGHGQTGENLVDHIRKQFGPYAGFEHVLLTHSDADHASGLRTVLKEIPVRNLWLHALAAGPRRRPSVRRPALDPGRSPEDDPCRVRHHRRDRGSCRGGGRATALPVRGRRHRPVPDPVAHALRLSAPAAAVREDAGAERGRDQGGFHVGRQGLAHAEDRRCRARQGGLLDHRVVDLGAAAGRRHHQREQRVRRGAVRRIRGRQALPVDRRCRGQRADLVGRLCRSDRTAAAELHLRADPASRQSAQRRSVGPDAAAGPVLPENTAGRFSAYVSAPKDDESHPRRIVLNAFKRRGGIIIPTQGINKIHWGGFPPRDGYGDVEGRPFYTNVEAYT